MLRFTTTLAMSCLIPSLCLASGGDAGHGGPLHAADIFDTHNLEFWGAVVNFTLLLLVLRKLMKKPLAGFLGTRRDDVEVGMKEAAEIKSKAEAVYQEYTERLKTMDDDMAKLRRDIETAAEADKKRILSDAEASAARLRKETEALVVQQGRELARGIQADVVQAAVSAAESVMREALSDDDQQRLAAQYQQDLVHTGERA